jgi:calcium uptake protein 1, mitochondrial
MLAGASITSSWRRPQQKLSSWLGQSVHRVWARAALTSSYVTRRGAVLAASGVVAGMVAAPTMFVCCRPLDTPDYLLPYYLRNNKSRFARYASIRKKNGSRYMTAEDFVCALLATKDTTLEDPRAAEDLAALFAATDANQDGKLSFSEFNFLMTLLTTKPKVFEVAFVMFDEENKSALTLPQFTRAVTALSDDDGKSMRSLAGGGILTKLFGTNGKRACSYKEFQQVVEQLQLEVWKAEFLQFDKKRRGVITAEQFGQLIAGQMLGSHLPFFIVENLRRLKGSESGTVPFASWVGFHKIMKHADDIGAAIELYTASGAPLKKRDFVRAMTAKGLAALSDAEVTLVYALFDKNGDGSLEYDEFISIMKEKISYHTREKEREKVNLFARTINCVAEVVDSQ